MTTPLWIVILNFILTDPNHRKERAIRHALKSEKIDVTTLRQLAIGRGGLLKNELRIEAWPHLLGVSVDDIDEKPGLLILGIF